MDSDEKNELPSPPVYGYDQDFPTQSVRSGGYQPLTAPQPVIIQPGQMPPQQIVVINQAAALPTKADLYSAYRVGLCDICRSCSNLFYCMFCPCYLTGKVTNRLDENCCYPTCFGIVPLSVRFRSLVGIQHGMCEEGCTFLWCSGCALLRLVNEMEERNFYIQRS